MSQEERKIVSYHEVGHALISALQKNSEPVQKITIVPRTMGALGYVMQVPEEEKYLQTKAELHDRLVGLLGGRAAEELIFGDVTTGAANDIEQATNIATNMVTRFGMSDRFGLMGLATVESEYLGGGARLTCSDRTAADVDTEVMELLKSCYEEAKQMLSGNRELMDKLAAHLIEKETISGKEFMKIYRAEKGIPEPEEKEEASGKSQDSTQSAENRNPEDFFKQESIWGETAAADNTEQPADNHTDDRTENRTNDGWKNESRPESDAVQSAEERPWKNESRDAESGSTSSSSDHDDRPRGVFSGMQN